ncbi:NAD(P)-dependent oxidoreductase [Phaeobacter sp. J2-8]|uniref:NAD-dependent epimerase/dehydratase family protein n=1 Tax=Phaeobacter sp. J2-8 TaxID=2931394 RepID=UPI001FD0476F|nr:NAD(P)-dependent oxidoreductase [Phaeobacter sp. J2-8]MCJ7874877.1 NAD(P)-dependent oxidoreductase [Phaeobacter sp. J2-8]
MRIAFTGGTGKAGSHIVPWLRSRGHRVLNLDLNAPQIPDNQSIDLTDSGQVFNALSGYSWFDELDLPEKPQFDAVVHFAALARILIKPDSETFRVNTLSTYNVLEAAVKLGIPKVIFASSETAYGICFAQGEKLPDYIPVDEEHPTLPHDSYAMSKVCNEACGRSFQARSGIDIYGLRINNVITPDEYQRDFPAFVADPALRRRNIFGYIDVRDLGQMVERCLKTDGLGYEVFNVANDDLSTGLTNEEVRAQFYADVPVKRAMSGHDSMYSNAKAKDLLGFQPEHSWRDVLG